MSNIVIDSLVIKLNQYLQPIYLKDVTVIQAHLDGDRIEEPYATVERGEDSKASYQRIRKTHADEGDSLTRDFDRNDRFDLIIQTYDDSIDDSKLLSERIFNWFQIILMEDPDYTVRSLTPVVPSRFEVAKETVNTFVFTVNLEEVTNVQIVEEKVEGIDFIVN